MATIEEFLCQGGQDNFAEAVKLNDVESLQDPVKEPYKSKYKARELFNNLKQDLDGLENVEETKLRRTAMMAAVNLRLGINYIESEELASGEEHLDKCVEALEAHRLNPVCCNVLQVSLNQLGILWSGREDVQKAKEYLDKAKTLYDDYKQQVGSSPTMADSLFQTDNTEDEGLVIQKQSNHFENTYTHTLYYLAQVYGRLEDNQKSAHYCQETLCRQLDTKQYDPVEWALNAATLSQYFLGKLVFPASRHCLASALCVLQETGDAPECLTVTPLPEETQTQLNDRERIPKAWADVYRCCVKYGLALLEYSRDYLYESLLKEEEPAQEVRNGEENSDDQKNNLHFNLELTAIEGQVRNTRALDFNDAREVFLITQKWLNATKEFYVLDGHCTDHVEIVQDHSKLFKLLAFFEPSYDRQCKMHKRRVDMMAFLISEISRQHYLLIWRQLVYEQAETYSSMSDLKLTLMEEEGGPTTTPTTHAKNKFNALISSSIEQYVLYLDSLRAAGDNKLPSRFSTDDERPALVAHFCVGRLYSKFLEPEVAGRIGRLLKALEYYKFLVDYCTLNTEAEGVVKGELEVCKEMVQLLPVQMDRIRAHADL